MYIYKITNKINKKIYIGQTTRSVKKRWHEHCKKDSGCSYLSKAIQKYGKENFTIEHLVTCSNLNVLNKFEEILIKKYNTLAPNGYNLIYGGNNHKFSKKIRIKISKKLGSKLFYVRNLETNEIMEFISKKICGQKLKIDSTQISGCLKGKYFTTKNYSFSYKDSNKLPLTLKEINNIKKNNKIKAHNGVSFYARNLETNKVLKFDCQRTCSSQLNIDQAAIYRCLYNKRYSIKGYSFCFISENRMPYTLKEISIIKKEKASKVRGGNKFFIKNIQNNEKFIFYTQQECADKLKISKRTVGRYLKNKKIYNNTYRFQYVI